MRKTTQIQSRQAVEAVIANIKDSKSPSISSGKLQDGRLVNAAELPKPGGIGYLISHPDRDTNFGADRMVFGLMRLGVTMQQKLGDDAHHLVLINEISDRDGGKQIRHINHQMGLDADIVFYCEDLSGNPQRPRWVSFDEHGLTADGKLRFDVKRNWTLLDEILSSETFGEIRAILVADALKKQIAQSRNVALHKDSITVQKRKGCQKNIKRAMELCRQPTSSPHDNHLPPELCSTNLKLSWKRQMS